MARGLDRLRRAGLPLTAADQDAISEAMFPLLLTKDLAEGASENYAELLLDTGVQSD
jgi:hypothetical protein